MAPFFCVVDFITVSGGGQSMEDSTQLDQWTWSNLWDIPTVNICITLHISILCHIEDLGLHLKGTLAVPSAEESLELNL